MYTINITLLRLFLYVGINNVYYFIYKGVYWSGSWTDLVIEQSLMRPLKTSGGIRGVGETQLQKWTASIPYSTVIGNAVDNFCGTYFTSSSQHKELSSSRQQLDIRNTNIFLN